MAVLLVHQIDIMPVTFAAAAAFFVKEFEYSIHGLHYSQPTVFL